MSYLFFSLLGLLLPLGKDADLTRVPATLEDMEGEKLMSVATHGETAFVVTWRGRLQKSFFLINLKSGTVFQIKDQRINFHGLFRALPTTDGFALVDQTTLKVMFLDPRAVPLATDQLQNFDGFPGAFRTRHVEGLPGQRLLVTYHSYTEEGWFLAEADLRNRTFEIVHFEPKGHSEKLFWAQKGTHRYRINRETGAIAVQKDNGFHKPLFPGRERVKKPHATRGQGYPGLPKYRGLLGNQVHGDDFLCFTLFNFDGYQPGTPPEKSLLFLHGTTLSQAPYSSTVPISTGSTSQLTYNAEERIFQRVPL